MQLPNLAHLTITGADAEATEEPAAAVAAAAAAAATEATEADIKRMHNLLATLTSNKALPNEAQAKWYSQFKSPCQGARSDKMVVDWLMNPKRQSADEWVEMLKTVCTSLVNLATNTPIVAFISRNDQRAANTRNLVTAVLDRVALCIRSLPGRYKDKSAKARFRVPGLVQVEAEFGKIRSVYYAMAKSKYTSTLHEQIETLKTAMRSIVTQLTSKKMEELRQAGPMSHATHQQYITHGNQGMAHAHLVTNRVVTHSEEIATFIKSSVAKKAIEVRLKELNDLEIKNRNLERAAMYESARRMSEKEEREKEEETRVRKSEDDELQANNAAWEEQRRNKMPRPPRRMK
jgi:hypothetical protein